MTASPASRSSASSSASTNAPAPAGHRRPTEEAALQVPGTTLVQTTDWFELGPEQADSRFPGKFLVYETAREARHVAAWGSIPPRADFFTLDGCSLDATLTPADFAPAD